MLPFRIIVGSVTVLFVLAGLLVYFFVREDPPATGLAGFHRPRTVHLAPPADGRVIVTDLGTGSDDGRVVAVDLDSGKQTVLLDHLPSTKNSGQRYADLAGPSGAAMARDGTVCAVIGDANKPGRGFDTLRCSNGLTADFKAFEAANNPDGREIASNPYDIVSDGQTGWYVSDAAANVVLHVDEHGTIEVAALFASFCCLANQGADPVPTGLSISISGRGDRFVGVALFGGAVGQVRLTANEPGLLFASLPKAIAVADNGKDSFFLTYEDAAGTPNSGAITATTFRLVATGLDHPTGMAMLPDGRFVVAEEARGRVRVVTPSK